MIQSAGDPCLFYDFKNSNYTLMTVTVDDCLIASKKRSHANELIKRLGKCFPISDLGIPKYVIGLHIKYEREEHQLKMNQRLYIEASR